MKKKEKSDARVLQSDNQDNVLTFLQDNRGDLFEFYIHSLGKAYDIIQYCARFHEQMKKAKMEVKQNLEEDVNFKLSERFQIKKDDYIKVYNILSYEDSTYLIYFNQSLFLENIKEAKKNE